MKKYTKQREIGENAKKKKKWSSVENTCTLRKDNPGGKNRVFCPEKQKF